MSQLTKCIPGLMAGFCLFLSQPVNAADTQKLSAQDKKFMMNAAKGGMMEVDMGKLGQEHGSSEGVKNLSMRLVDDHTKGNEQLMMLAMQKGVTLPADNPALVPKSLSTLSGTAFDKKFVSIAIADHEKDIAAFEKEASSGNDPDVKMWASNTLPTLRSHLDAAKALANSSGQ